MDNLNEIEQEQKKLFYDLKDIGYFVNNRSDFLKNNFKRLIKEGIILTKEDLKNILLNIHKDFNKIKKDLNSNLEGIEELIEYYIKNFEDIRNE